MRRGSKPQPTTLRNCWVPPVQATCALAVVALAWAIPHAPALAATPACQHPVYLTLDTGHMGVAPLIAEVLNRQNVKATFFLANEPTQTGGTSLDDQWAPWWRARATEGHAFATHTFDHTYWKADRADGSFTVRPSAGPRNGETFRMTPAEYCRELNRSADRFEAMTGQRMSAAFRAPGGKTSKALLQAARQCGYTHVGWSPAGFLGDELSSEQAPNAHLLKQALRNIQSGDILLAHLGIWSRKDPWAPAVLEPLLVGLKDRGFCFETLRNHPQLGAAFARQAPRP